MMQYIAAFPTLGLRYKSIKDSSPALRVFGDCSFAPTGKASHEGNPASVSQSLVAWRSKRQTLTAMSSCEGELIAASHSLIVGRSLRLLVAELFGLPAKQQSSTILVDNKAATGQLKRGEVAPWRSRHISIRGHALVVATAEKEITIDFCGTTDMAADGLTKALTPAILQRMRELWGMVLV